MNLAERPKEVEAARFTERRAKITISATSPDRTVTARSSQEDGVVVELAPGCLELHSMESLAGQIRAAVNGAVAGYRKAIGVVIGDLAPRRAADPRRDEVAEAIAAIEFSQTSKDNDVTITWRGGDIDVKLRRGCLVRYIELQLARTVNRTLADGARRYVREVDKIHESVYRQP